MEKEVGHPGRKPEYPELKALNFNDLAYQALFSTIIL